VGYDKSWLVERQCTDRKAEKRDTEVMESGRGQNGMTR
jgi:hypothetical protein